MARIPNRDVKDAFDFVAHRDGRKCYYEGPLCKGKLILHHVDNNSDNNAPGNWRIVCAGHNTRLNPRGRDKRHKNAYVKEWMKGRGNGGYRQKEVLGEIRRMGREEGDDDPTRRKYQSAEMEKNNICEPAFRQWVEDIITKLGRVKTTDIINGGAEKVGISQQSSKRYLDKMCSFTGRFQYVRLPGEDGTYIELKPEFKALVYGDTGRKQGKKGKGSDGISSDRH